MSDIDFSKLPNKKYYSISEVSNLLGIKQTEIRYWEKFDPKLRSNSLTRTYDLKRIRLLFEMKMLIKDQGIKPGKISSYLNAKKNPRPQQLKIKKELIKIKNIIKKTRKLKIK